MTTEAVKTETETTNAGAAGRAKPAIGTLHTTIDDCVDAVNDVFNAVFERIEEGRSDVELHVHKHDGVVTRAGIDAVVEVGVVRELSREQVQVIGAGFVAAPGFISDAEWHLAWWLGNLNTFGAGTAAPRIRRLETVEDPAHDSFRDYTSLEWWRVPADTGRRHITGPYVDYLCTDEYTLTLTMPVDYQGAMIGVAGADLYVDDVERALLPRLRAVGTVATLVNSSGRVLLSTDARLATGSLLRLPGLIEALRGSPVSPPSILDDGHRVFACGDTGLSLVVAP